MIWILLPLCFLAGAALGFLAAVARTPRLVASMTRDEMRAFASRVADLRHPKP